ncbi:MAG: CBS domain-containing protein [Acidobacteriota bacterium]
MPHRLKVRDLMTAEVITLSEDDTLADARTCMDRGCIRHLPVVRDGKLVGLVTHRDLLAASLSVFSSSTAEQQHRLLASIPVRELMHDAVAVTPELSVREAARIMLDNQFGCLPVIDESGVLLGIITDADYLRLAVKMLEAIQA